MFNVNDRLALALGYSNRRLDGTVAKRLIITDFSADAIEGIENLLAQIEEIDELYKTALADSMAVKVDKLELDYRQHLFLLTSRGSLLLNQLSAYTGIPLVFDRFTGRTVGGNTSNSINIRSYY
jgi:hypothetical protein